MELVLVLGALGAAPLGAAAAAAVGRRSADLAARVAAVIVLVGWAATIALAAQHLATPRAESSVGLGWVALRIDGLALIMLLLVLGLSAVIQFFAVQYMRGDVRQQWFVVTANLVTASTAVMVCASSILGFALTWLAAGASLIALLATYRHLPQGALGVRLTALRLSLGDLALMVAIAQIMIYAGGDVSFADLRDAIASQPTPLASAVVVLLVVPALARSSQVPFHGWLPTTLAAPTPISALMHAGVVNAGAILLLRFSPATGYSTLAMTLVFTAGMVTLIFASAVRLTKPDVKGRLVYSTMAQMGFMMLACGLGAYAAAVFHLVAHGLYKATLFLGAGSGVAREARERAWPARVRARAAQKTAAITIAIIVAVGALASSRAVLAIELAPASQALQMFVVFTAALALATVLTTHFSPATVLGGGLAITALTFGYTALVAAFESVLDFTSSAGAGNPWWLAVGGITLIALQLIAGAKKATGLNRRLYAFCLAAGYPRTTTKTHHRLAEIGASQ